MGVAMSYLEELFEEAGRPLPAALIQFEEQLDDWCDEYRRAGYPSQILEIKLGTFVYLFDFANSDLVEDRVVIAYGLSRPEGIKRDTSRMKGFPNASAAVRAILGDEAFPADKGHFLGHASGGQLDINLFPQLRSLNRGWSAAGKTFRQMESRVAEKASVFFYHRPIYADATWLPSRLEYGILVDDRHWWVEIFDNRQVPA
jgi:hypothetical protein